jgi:ATP-dependent Clp protease ATP-binding subunit ClpA
LIQDTIRSALADELLFGKLANGGKVIVDVKNGKVGLEFEEEAVPA